MAFCDADNFVYANTTCRPGVCQFRESVSGRAEYIDPAAQALHQEVGATNHSDLLSGCAGNDGSAAVAVSASLLLQAHTDQAHQQQHHRSGMHYQVENIKRTG